MFYSELSKLLFPLCTEKSLLNSVLLTQLHQLRQHTSATVIMPSEGTTEEGATEARRSEKKSFTADWLKNSNGQNAQRNPSMRHFVLLRIKSQRWDHVNSQSVCLLCCYSQLIGPAMKLAV